MLQVATSIAFLDDDNTTQVYLHYHFIDPTVMCFYWILLFNTFHFLLQKHKSIAKRTQKQMLNLHTRYDLKT
jgi:hypothetical protein